MERPRALTQSPHEGFSELSLEQSRAEALRGAWRGEGSPAACRLSEQGRALQMAGRVRETGVTGLTRGRKPLQIGPMSWDVLEKWCLV